MPTAARRTFSYAKYTGLVAAIVSLAAGPALAQNKAAQREAHCADRRTASEREICIDRDLTRRDAYLNEVYQELKGLLSTSDFRGLRIEQRAWLRERNRCGARKSCLADSYTDRTAILEQMIENQSNPGISHVEIGCGPQQDFINGECFNKLEDEGFAWLATTYRDQLNGNRKTASLSYGVPETDNIAFSATCRAGASRGYATAIFGYDISGQRSGREVSLQVTIGGYRENLPGKVYLNPVDEGVSGVVVAIGPDDPFWETLASGSAMTYALDNKPTTRLGLNGSGQAARQFVADCLGGTQTASTGGADVELHASCEAWGKIRSQNSNTPITLTFVNRSGSHRAVTWINFEGTPVDYAALNDGESYTVNTYLTHPWMFTDGPGNCMEIYVPKAGDRRFEITAQSPAFGPGND